MATFGSGSTDNDNSFTEFGAILLLIAKRQIEELDHIAKHPWPAEPAVVCRVACLRVLSESFPHPEAFLEKDEVELWAQTYFDWFSKVENRLPKKYRDGMREVAEKEFSRLLELVSTE